MAERLEDELDLSLDGCVQKRCADGQRVTRGWGQSSERCAEMKSTLYVALSVAGAFSELTFEA